MAASMTPVEAVKSFVSNLQKKQRNLGKRKGKLDHYRELLNKGETLNEEQKKAVMGYDGVLQSITLLQEVMTQTKELVDDVELAEQHRQKEFEESLEGHTISFLRTHVCLMQLINALDNAELRTAIVKSASPHHLRMLDTVRDLFVAPIVVNWPGTNAASLSSAPDFIQNQSGFDSAAKHIHNLVLGRPVPIPLPEDYDGPQRKFNFKEARALCFRLLANPTIQRCLGAQPIAECSAPHTLEEIKSNPIASTQGTAFETHQEYISQDMEERRHDLPSIPTAYENPLPHRPVEHDTVPNVVDGVGRPLGGTFNFLQASKVMSPEPVLEYPPSQLKPQVTGHVHAEPIHHPVEPVAPQVPTAGGEFQERAEHLYNDIHPDHFEQIPPSTFATPVEPVHPMPLSEMDPTDAVSSKPACYADLFRRQNQANQQNGQRESNARRVERTHASPTLGEIGDTKTFVDADLPSHSNARGRGSGGEFRGGRGQSTRGYSRGFMNGPARRPYGGPRIGRGGGAQSGRGRANLHGAPRTNVAQA